MANKKIVTFTIEFTEDEDEMQFAEDWANELTNWIESDCPQPGVGTVSFEVKDKS